MSRRRPTPRYSYCESVSATQNVWHVRLMEVGEEPRLGGGIATGPLAGCWTGNGWDVNRPFIRSEAEEMAATLDDTGRPMVCPRCVAELPGS